MEKLEVGKESVEKRSRSSLTTGSSRSENEMSIKKYLENNIFVRSMVPVGELQVQKQFFSQV